MPFLIIINSYLTKMNTQQELLTTTTHTNIKTRKTVHVVPYICHAGGSAAHDDGGRLVVDHDWQIFAINRPQDFGVVILFAVFICICGANCLAWVSRGGVSSI